jgi:hypothetical protein
VSLDLIIEIKKTSFPPCGIYGNQFYASLDPKFFNEDPILLSKPLSIISDGFAKSIKEAINSRLYSGYPIEAKHIIYNICINDKQPSLYKDFLIRVALDIASKKSSAPTSKEHFTQEDGSILFVERDEPLRLIYEHHNDINQKVVYNIDIGGFYRPTTNLIKFESETALVHEVAHAAVNIIFGNEALPYPKDKGEVYKAYLKVESTILYNLANKLGYNQDEEINKFNDRLDITDNNYGFKYKVKYLPEIKLLHNALRKSAELNIFEVREIENKLKELNITDDEAYIIAGIGSLLIDYNFDCFSGELIAKATELYYQKPDSKAVLNDILAPINDFSQTYIHPAVLDKIEAHKSYCASLAVYDENGVNAKDGDFTFCIDEILQFGEDLASKAHN